MADLFNWSEVEDKPAGSGSNQKYIYPGVFHNIVIKSIKEDKNKNGTPFVRLTIYSKEGGPELAKSFDMYLTSGALPYTQRNLLHIGNCIVKEEEFKKAKSIEDINDLLAGESLRMKFDGEEYEYQGEVKTKAVIGFPPFAEPIQDGAEHPAIANEDTKLVYNPEKHLKKLAKPEDDGGEEEPQSNATQDDVDSAWGV